MYAIKTWQSEHGPKRKVYYVAEDGICVYEAKNKQDAESYIAFLLRHPKAK